MKNKAPSKALVNVLTVIFLAAVIFVRVKFSAGFDYRNTNFAFFWLAGRMVLDGENPYNEAQYLAGHDANGMEWKPNQIFPYPLPLALFCIPLGLFSMGTAFTLWQIFTLLVTAFVTYSLLKKWNYPPLERFFAPLFLFIVFFGPVFMTVRVGNIGTLALLFLFLALIFWDKEKPFWAGVMLAMTLLKPPQGGPIMILFCVWLLARKDWKAFYGIAAGGIALLIVGLLQDPQWIGKFLNAGDAVMARTQGIHSNVWAAAYLICHGKSPCAGVLGGLLSLGLLGMGAWLLWKNQAQWSAWEALNFILPVAFMSTIYLWVYDQLPYIIPLVWTAGAIVKLTRTYLYIGLFLIALDLFTMYELLILATKETDLWSFATSFIVLGVMLVLQRWKPAIDKPIVSV